MSIIVVNETPSGTNEFTIGKGLEYEIFPAGHYRIKFSLLVKEQPTTSFTVSPLVTLTVKDALGMRLGTFIGQVVAPTTLISIDTGGESLIENLIATMDPYMAFNTIVAEPSYPSFVPLNTVELNGSPFGNIYSSLISSTTYSMDMSAAFEDLVAIAPDCTISWWVFDPESLKNHIDIRSYEPGNSNNDFAQSIIVRVMPPAQNVRVIIDGIINDLPETIPNSDEWHLFTLSNGINSGLQLYIDGRLVYSRAYYDFFPYLSRVLSGGSTLARLGSSVYFGFQIWSRAFASESDVVGLMNLSPDDYEMNTHTIEDTVQLRTHEVERTVTIDFAPVLPIKIKVESDDSTGYTLQSQNMNGSLFINKLA
jgi:hypothetical protein